MQPIDVKELHKQEVEFLLRNKVKLLPLLNGKAKSHIHIWNREAKVE